MPVYFDDEHAVVARSRKLERRARRWRVEVPKEWCFPDSDGAYVIGALYHDALGRRICNAQRTILIQILAGISVTTIIANFVRGRR